MLFPHELIYTYEKLYLLAALLPAIISTTAISAHIMCSYLDPAPKKALFLLAAVILTLQAGQFLAAVSPPRELPFFAALQGSSFCLLGAVFYQFAYAAVRKKFLKPSRAAALFLLPGVGAAPGADQPLPRPFLQDGRNLQFLLQQPL